MFEQVVASPAMNKVPAERYDKGKQAPDVFASASSSRTATERRTPYGVRERHLLPALVSSSTRQRPSAPARLPVGIIFYLASITLVATATIGVFFGVGFFLLMGSAEGMIPNGAHNSDTSPPFFAAVSRFLSSPSPNADNLAPAPIEAATSAGYAAAAALPPAPLSQRSIPDRQAMPDHSEMVPSPPPSIVDVAADISKDAPSTGNRPGSEADVTAAAPPAPTVGTAEPTPSALAAEAMPAPPHLVLSATEVEELLTRGDTLLRMGDVTSARLFYERVANAGIGQGAMRMGATFDSSFLGRIGLGSARGDPVKAQSWYRRAIELSRTEIEHQPNALKMR
jgi:hypothetical protein